MPRRATADPPSGTAVVVEDENLNVNLVPVPWRAQVAGEVCVPMVAVPTPLSAIDDEVVVPLVKPVRSNEYVTPRYTNVHCGLTGQLLQTALVPVPVYLTVLKVAEVPLGTPE